MSQNTVSIKVKTGFNSKNEMDYSLRGISEAEIESLKLEFKPEAFLNYTGTYKLHYMYPGIEVLIYLLEKHEAVLLNDYQQLFHPPQCEVFPYLLNDDRVVVITGGGAMFYKNEKEYVGTQASISYLRKSK